MKEISSKVADFFCEMDESLRNPMERAVFLRSVSSALGVFFHNNYEPQGYEEMANLVKRDILELAQKTKEQVGPHIHVVVNIQEKKNDPL